MPQQSSLTLLSRPGCHLCEQAALLLRGFGVDFVMRDVDASEMTERYGDAIPVLLDGNRELARAPMDAASLRQALQVAGMLDSPASGQ